MVVFYICSIRHCGALLIQPDQQGMTTVLLVSGCTSAGDPLSGYTLAHPVNHHGCILHLVVVPY